MHKAQNIVELKLISPPLSLNVRMKRVVKKV